MKVNSSRTKAIYHSPARASALAWLPILDSRVVALALVTGTLVGLVLVLGRNGYDDPYITYRYAANILHGHGFVYNEGQRVLSTTAPLYALLLAGLGIIWPDLALLSNVVSAVSLVAGALILYRLAVRRGETAVGLMVLLLVPVSALLTRTFGAETCLYVALILAAFYAYDAAHSTPAAVLLALATVIRPDAVLAAVAIATYHLARGRRPAWRAMVVYAALVGAWFAGLWLYFGSPIPVTLAAKQQQGQMPITTSFSAGLVELGLSYVQLPIFWLHAALAAAGLGRVLARQHHWLPLLLWTLLYVVAYSLLRVGTYFWYYAPLLPALVVLLSEGVVALVRGLIARRVPRGVAAGGAMLLILLLLASFLWDSVWSGSRADRRLAPSVEAGRWIAEHTPPDATIGMLEIGVIGYYAEREVVDFAGLLQPDIARQITTATTYADSALWAIEHYRPDYVVLPGGALRGLLNSESFRAAYAPIKVFTGDDPFWLVLYQRGAQPAVSREQVEVYPPYTVFSSLPWGEQVALFLSRLVDGRPYILGSEGFYVAWGGVYAVTLVVFLGTLGQALVAEREGER